VGFLEHLFSVNPLQTALDAGWLLQIFDDEAEMWKKKDESSVP